MRNLKKILAFVLALVMSLSIMSIASASDYYTDVNRDSDYVDAIELLSDYGVIRGFTTGGFGPELTIDRAQVAAIVYRIMTGDTSDTYANNFASYSSVFPDVKTGEWYAGYVGYCANAGLLKGFPNGTFAPNSPVTGYQTLAILLRAVGYGKLGEYEGSKWEINTLSDATRLGILDKVVKTDFRSSAPRGVVAQLTANAVKAPRVTYTPANGYSFLQDPTKLGASSTNVSLIKDDVQDSQVTKDLWGVANDYHTINFTYPATWKEAKYLNSDTLVAEYYGPVLESEVASLLMSEGYYGFDGYKPATFTAKVNGDNTTAEVVIEATDTVNYIGQQGRWTRIYRDDSKFYDEDNPEVDFYFIYVDTFVGEVKSVSARTFDSNGHLVQPAKITFEIKANQTSNNMGYGPTTYTCLNYDADYTEKKEDIVAIRVRTTPSNALTNAVEAVTAWYEDDYVEIAGGLTNKKYPWETNSDTMNSFNMDWTVITPTVATVSAITRDGTAKNGQTEIGVVAGGNRYLYNYTFCGDRLTTDSIGSAVKLWLDANGNILKWEYANDTKVIGVVTDVDVERVSVGKYVLVYNVLTAESANPVTIRVEKADGKFYDSLNEANLAAETAALINTLVDFRDTDGDTYYEMSSTTGLSATLKNANFFERGTADTINGTLMDDKTVIFVANYRLSNRDNEYKFVNYTIYKGFRSLTRDLGIDAGVNTIDGLVANGLDVTYLYGGDERAEYVLVKNATTQTIRVPELVDNYAYLLTDNRFVDVADDSWTFTAIINGKQSNLVITSAATADIAVSGLYTYSGQTTNGYEFIEKSNNVIAAGTHSYKEGVLTNGNQYLTVANNCQVYVINPKTGSSVVSNLDALEAYKYCDLAYQLDADGYISLIYIVESGTWSN